MYKYEYSFDKETKLTTREVVTSYPDLGVLERGTTHKRPIGLIKAQLKLAYQGVAEEPIILLEESWWALQSAIQLKELALLKASVLNERISEFKDDSTRADNLKSALAKITNDRDYEDYTAQTKDEIATATRMRTNLEDTGRLEPSDEIAAALWLKRYRGVSVVETRPVVTGVIPPADTKKLITAERNRTVRTLEDTSADTAKGNALLMAMVGSMYNVLPTAVKDTMPPAEREVIEHVILKMTEMPSRGLRQLNRSGTAFIDKLFSRENAIADIIAEYGDGEDDKRERASLRDRRNKANKEKHEDSSRDEDSKESKVEESKVEESKVEESKVEESKVEDSKVEDSKVEESKVEDSKVEDSKVEESKVEDSKVEDSKDNTVDRLIKLEQYADARILRTAAADIVNTAVHTAMEATTVWNDVAEERRVIAIDISSRSLEDKAIHAEEDSKLLEVIDSKLDNLDIVRVNAIADVAKLTTTLREKSVIVKELEANPLLAGDVVAVEESALLHVAHSEELAKLLEMQDLISRHLTEARRLETVIKNTLATSQAEAILIADSGEITTAKTTLADKVVTATKQTVKTATANVVNSKNIAAEVAAAVVAQQTIDAVVVVNKAIKSAKLTKIKSSSPAVKLETLQRKLSAVTLLAVDAQALARAAYNGYLYILDMHNKDPKVVSAARVASAKAEAADKQAIADKHKVSATKLQGKIANLNRGI